VSEKRRRKKTERRRRSEKIIRGPAEPVGCPKERGEYKMNNRRSAQPVGCPKERGERAKVIG